MTPAEALERLVAPNRPRAAQLEGAEAAFEAIASGRRLAVEAPTGTGKTLMMLAALIASGRKAVYSTNTKALQHQVLDDLARARDAFGTSYAYLKGRSNYICLHRRHYLRDGDLKRRALLVTGERAMSSQEFTRSEWESVSVDSSQCLYKDCEFYDSCAYNRAKRHAVPAAYHDGAEPFDVLVLNHSLLAAWMHLPADAPDYLGGYGVYLVDEAHTFADVFRRGLSSSVHPGRFGSVAADLRRLKRDDLRGRLKDCGDHLAGVLDGWRENVPLPDDEPMPFALYRPAVADAVQFFELNGHPDEAVRARGVPSAMDRAERPGQLRRVVSDDYGRKLKTVPLSVADRIKWPRGVVACSATLDDHAPAEIGMDGAKRLGDTFDHYNSTGLYVPKLSVPRGEESYRVPRDDAWNELAWIIEQTGGGVLALFTSWPRLYEAHRRVSRLLSGRFELLSQRRGEPTNRLADAFRDSEDACLFATRSFFEGADFPGRTCRAVTLDKVPTPTRDDESAVVRRLLGGLGWNAWGKATDKAMAALTIRQALGRLIRRDGDGGLLAILDVLAASDAGRAAYLSDFPFMPVKHTRSGAQWILDRTGPEPEEGTVPVGLERERRLLAERDGGDCYICGRPPEGMDRRGGAQVEHVTPRALGGTDHQWNKALACRKCNLKKSDTPPREFFEARQAAGKRLADSAWIALERSERAGEPL